MFVWRRRTPPPAKAQDDSEQKDLDRILKIIEDSNSNIATLEGKSVVVFLGGSRVGKSTTIDALLGAKLEYTSSGSVIVAPDSPKIPMAKIGDVQGVSTTTVPALYSQVGSPYAYLDTRGYFDVRYDSNEDAAASIITDLAVQRAKDVRIVYLCDCHSFREGLVGFQRFGQLLGDIVYSADIPIFFLFNKYNPTKMQYDKGFHGMPYEAQEDIIREQLLEDRANIHKGVETVLKHVEDRIIKQVRKEEVDAAKLEEIIKNDQNYIAALTNRTYDDMLTKSFDKGWFTYIDPCEPKSVTSFLSKIYKFPALNPREPIFSHRSGVRQQFNSMFERQILRLRGLLRQKEFALTYRWRIDACRKELEADLERCKQDAATVEEQCKQDADTMEQQEVIRTLNAFYSEDIQKKYNDNESVIATLKENIEYNKQAVAELKVGEDVASKVTWYEQAKFYWWRDHPVRYNAEKRGSKEHPIPYTRIEEALGENVYRTAVIQESPENFHVIYSSASTNLKKVIIGTAFLAPMWCALSYPCSGTVTFFAKREDLEWENIQSLEKQIEKLQQIIIERQTVAQNFGPQFTLSLPDKIRVSQAYIENGMKKLPIIEAFIKDILAKWAIDPQSGPSEIQSIPNPPYRYSENPGTEIQKFVKYAHILFREEEAPVIYEFLSYVEKVESLGDGKRASPESDFTALSSAYDAVLPLAVMQ